MKFRIRFADQIVGVFIIAALVSLVLVVFMLGRAHRWFANDEVFNTQFSAATGLSKNMPIVYKGFVIGSVQSFNLNENDLVDVVFVIHEDYLDKVRRGSTVQLSVSPIGLGNQFVFHSGRGRELHKAGDFIPAAGTPEAARLLRDELAEEAAGDSISDILATVGSLLTTLDAAFKGDDETAMGQVVGGLNQTVAALPDTVSSLNATIDSVSGLLAGVRTILREVDSLIAQISAPDGMVGKIIDGDGQVYASLEETLGSLSGIMDSLDNTVAFLPSQLPQIAGLLVDLRVTLKTAEDVLTALTNNPLLKKGIPERVDVQSSGTNPRNIQF